MNIYAFRSGYPNQASITKNGTDTGLYAIDFTDGLPGTQALSTVVTTALDSNNLTVTGSCISSTTISGNQAVVQMLTCGAGGTSAPTNGARFRLTTTATLVAGAIYKYDVYVFIINPTYAPIPA